MDYRSFYPGSAEVRQLTQELSALPMSELLERASFVRDTIWGRTVTFSPKVFIPLTRLCKDSCGYCTFAKSPREVPQGYLSPEEVIEVAKNGAALGCTEALFTLGEQPERRYRQAAEALSRLGHDTTISYLTAVSNLVQEETGLLAHINAGIMQLPDLKRLREVSASQGLMLESSSERLCNKGGPHFGCSSKHPRERISTLADAGIAKVPFTSGILIGIGETRSERIEALLVLRNLHRVFGHIQEVIVQNFRAKANTKMNSAEEPDFRELLWSAAVARLILEPSQSLQVPPNLSFERFGELLAAGINDWGGVSPLTPDYVNPEAPWPELQRLEQVTAERGFNLVRRLPVYPAYVRNAATWSGPVVRSLLISASDSEGFARNDRWSPGLRDAQIKTRFPKSVSHGDYHQILAKAKKGATLSEEEIEKLFHARGGDVSDITTAANELRQSACGDEVSYVVNRNINYTNICKYRCSFCAFSKGKTTNALRGKPYNISLEEVTRRVSEAVSRGATEVCMQGGIHPEFNGQTYLDLVAAARTASKSIHIHAFSPLEVVHGASTLGIGLEEFLISLRDAGLGSLPGTAAEILDDEVRSVICPDKISAHQWVETIKTAHRIGLKTTSTIMFGHVDGPRHWARHLHLLRELQQQTGGITEFVPLPFVHMEAPMYMKGLARKGPTSRETILMHAIARLVLYPLIINIQTSWVKLGREGAAACLSAGANDLGGTLMNESITRAAGSEHGQELAPPDMEDLIISCHRKPRQRTTLYQNVSPEQHGIAWTAAPLSLVVNDLVPVAH